MSKLNTTRVRTTASHALFASLAMACSSADGEHTPASSPESSAPAPGYGFSLELGSALPAYQGLPSDELVAKGFLRRTEQSNAEMFTISKGQPDVPLRPTSTHICFLTRLSGDLQGGGSGAAVHHNNADTSSRCGRFDWWLSLSDDTGPMWKLGHCQLAPGSLTAEATCVPGTNFVADPGAILVGSNMGFAVSTCNTISVNMWTGHAVTFLSMLAGDFYGGGEAGEVAYDPLFTNPTKLLAKNEACHRVEAAAYSLFVGVPGQVTGRIPYAVSAQRNESKTVRMQRTRDAVCYLTKLSGDFNGSPERVRIFPQKDASGIEYWMLEAHADRGSAYGRAECIPYNQRSPVLP